MEPVLINNDVLRRLRYTFNFNDKKMSSIFFSFGVEVTREQISQWLKKDNDTDFVSCTDKQLASFLNGFINEKRGKKPGTQPVAEQRLTNNIILTKLKIALNLQAEELISILDSVGFRLSKPELSAFSRKADHKHYRVCKDQILRNLLQAIDKKYHVARTVKFETSAVENDKKLDDKQPKAPLKKKVKTDSNVQGARPNASTIYKNPKATPKKNNTSNSDQSDQKKRNTLKLK